MASAKSATSPEAPQIVIPEDFSRLLVDTIAAAYPPPEPFDGTVHMDCRMWRENGRWAIELSGPSWVALDILVEVNEAVQVHVEPFEHPAGPGHQTVIMRFLRKGEERAI